MTESTHWSCYYWVAVCFCAENRMQCFHSICHLFRSLFSNNFCSPTGCSRAGPTPLTPFIPYLKEDVLRWGMEGGETVGFKKTRTSFPNKYYIFVISSQGFRFAIVSLWRSIQIPSHGRVRKADHWCRVSMLCGVTGSCFDSAGLYSVCQLEVSRTWFGRRFPGGDYHVNRLAMLVGKSELNAEKRSIRAWLELYLNAERYHH